MFSHSNSYTLSIFAILERLITNDGYNKAGSPSIVWQLKYKMKLINNMFAQPMDLHFYFQFGDTPPETVFEKLYRIRSKIAHGEKIDYEHISLRNDFFIKEQKKIVTYRINGK